METETRTSRTTAAQRAYCTSLRILSLALVVSVAFYIALTTYGRVSPWGI